MPLISVAKARLKKLLYRLVMSVREVALDRPRLRVVLRTLGQPVIVLMRWVSRGPPPTVPEPVLRLPLDYEPAAPPLSTVILLHAYHVEVLPEMAALLRRLPFPADLVVTTDAEAKRAAILAAFEGWTVGGLEVRVTPNRGRNVGPQLIACRDVVDAHELVLILHTKVSAHTDALAGWREFLLRDLVGSAGVARGVMEAFARLPKLGVLAPRTFPLIRRHMTWGENYAACRGLADRLGFALFPDSPLDFPAGFMFWARSAALRPLLDLNLDWEDFPTEAGQKDGTVAHALERLIFHACERAGYRWARGGVELDPQSPEAFYAAWTPRVLARALTEHGRAVLIPGRVPEPTAGTDAETLRAAPDPKAAFRAACRAELDAFLARGDRLVLPTSETPVVSILLVLFNQAELTFEGLRALRLALDAPCEVILVDNASSDRTAELLDRIDGARIVRNSENLHFLRGVNQGAELARGRCLLLLNNDARLVPGAIAAAVERLDAEPDLGAVGGRITLLDGRLQEAGSIIWSDGSCLGYGRGMDPWAPEFQFRRDVDYCSGAFLMTPRALFERLGRFDMAFAPAYYEETDLCMRIREAGLRIGYDPRILLSHFEFGSSSSSEAALALQADHSKIFQARHAAVLQADHRPPGTAPFEARMRGGFRGRVLIVEDQIPYPQLGAGYPRALDLLRATVAAGWFVTFYPLVYPDVDYADAYGVLPPGVEIAADRGEGGLADFMRERPDYYDAAIVSRPHNMAVFRTALAEAPGFIGLSKVVYDAEAIFALREEARARIAREREKAKGDVAAELALGAGAAVILAVNEVEADAFRRAGAPDVRVLGHGIAPRPTAIAFEDRGDLLFVGAMDENASPNADALEVFVREIMPRLDALIGADWVLRVAGRHGAARVQALSGPRVQLLGPVDDLQPLYARSRVFIAPTRYAGGIPMKVQEAAARGLPAATTSLLARQLGWADGEALVVGDAPEAFAQACQRLYQDAALWEAIRAGALARISAECAPEAFAATVATALDAVAGRQAASSSSSLRMSVTGEATPPSSRMTLLQ
ncbi:glycosyltransferase [Phenylobacterium sp. LjRoot225]|uniref:rhamnan synthesis F family protein n=1 Tax=Phenylobacterium sp. LjRoot225 TaxID=3342285 RepID=UPI003ECCDD3E